MPVHAEIAGELGLAGHLGDGIDARHVVADGGERSAWRLRAAVIGRLIPERLTPPPSPVRGRRVPRSAGEGGRGLTAAIRPAASSTASMMFQ